MGWRLPRPEHHRLLAELWSASSWSNRWPLRARQASSCLSALPCRFSLDVKAALSFRAQSPGGPEALLSGGRVPLRPGQARPATLSPGDSALTSSEVLGPANPWVLNSQNILPTRSGSYLLQGPPLVGRIKPLTLRGVPGVHLAAFTFENQDALPPFAPRLGSYPLRPQRGTPPESGRAVLTTRPGGARARSGTTACTPLRHSC